MSWTITTPDGEVVNSDDFTLEEADAVEKLAGEPWILMNPVRTISAARGFIAIGWVRAGLSPEEITERLAKLTLADIRGAFEYLPDEKPPDPKAKAPKGRTPKSETTRPDGIGLERPLSSGHQRLRAANE